EASRFGSSGQQRSALLILVLAQISLYNNLFEDYPIFLLDDIDAELDLGRIRTVLEHLGGKTQTFISTSKRAITGWFSGPTAYRLVEAGQAIPAPPDRPDKPHKSGLDYTETMNSVAAPDAVLNDHPKEKELAVELAEVDPHKAPF